MSTIMKNQKRQIVQKLYEQQGRRVQTEALDNDDQFDMQTAILKFKNLQDPPQKKSKPTSITKQMNIMKKPETLKDNSNSSVYIGKKENNLSQHKKPNQSKSPHGVPQHVGIGRFVNNTTFLQTNTQLEAVRSDSKQKYNNPTTNNRQTNTQSLLIPSIKQEEDYSAFTYTNLKVVGSGSFGVVYKSKVNETGEVVAIKKVLQDKRYKNRELQILQELNHPNVLRLKHAFFTQADDSEETYLHVVMEFFQETLYSYNRTFVKQKQFMPNILVKIYAYQLLRSIGYISTKDICHRDIKPHNILVNPISNRLLLCDFGSAKRLIKGEPNIAYICSRCYRAPELIFGATDYNTQIDVWSAGCVIAEMFNGEPLFLGESAVDQLVEIIKVLGTPSKDQVLSMNQSYDLNQYKFVQIKKRDWKKVMREKMDPLGLDLVGKLLVYSPTIRYNPLQALSHPYFDELRDESSLKMLQLKKIAVPDLFDFTRGCLLFLFNVLIKQKEEFGKEIHFAQKLIPRWYQSKVRQ